MNHTSALIREPESLTQETEITKEELRTKIVANSIHFTYENTKILNDINLTVKEGEFLALMGRAAAEKAPSSGFWQASCSLKKAISKLMEDPLRTFLPIAE